MADLLEQVPERTLIELTNESVGFDEQPPVNATVVESCIRYAGELIDAHLRGRYTLPLTEVPTVLRDIAITLTRYRLYVRRPEGDLPDTVKDDNKEARRQLEAIRDGSSRWGCSPLREMCLSPVKSGHGHAVPPLAGAMAYWRNTDECSARY